MRIEKQRREQCERRRTSGVATVRRPHRAVCNRLAVVVVVEASHAGRRGSGERWEEVEEEGGTGSTGRGCAIGSLRVKSSVSYISQCFRPLLMLRTSVRNRRGKTTASPPFPSLDNVVTHLRCSLKCLDVAGMSCKYGRNVSASMITADRLGREGKEGEEEKGTYSLSRSALCGSRGS